MAGFRNSSLSNNSSSSGIRPEYESYDYEAPLPVALPAPPVNNASFQSSDSRSSNDFDNGSSQAGIDFGKNESIRQGGMQATTDPNQIAGGILGVLSPIFPAAGALSLLADGGRPRAGYTGSEGTIGANGGVFNSQGREISSVSGKAYNNYGSRADFYDGSYMSGIKNAKGFGETTKAIFSDPDNAFQYDRDSTVPQHQQFAFGNKYEKGKAPLSYKEDLDYQMPFEKRDAVSLEKGFEMGIPEHSMEAGSATRDALNGITTSSGAAPAGSQYSSDGVFSSGNDDNNGNNDDHGGYNDNDFHGFNAGGKVPPLNSVSAGKETGNYTVTGKSIYQDPLTNEFQSEQRITVGHDGAYGHMPSIYSGRLYNDRDVERLRELNAVPEPDMQFKTSQDADYYAGINSKNLQNFSDDASYFSNTGKPNRLNNIMQDPLG